MASEMGHKVAMETPWHGVPKQTMGDGGWFQTSLGPLCGKVCLRGGDVISLGS